MPKVYIIISPLRFDFKVNVQEAFSKKLNFLEFSCFGYFFVLLVELFYIPRIDYMYDLMCKVFLAKTLHISWV